MTKRCLIVMEATSKPQSSSSWKLRVQYQVYEYGADGRTGYLVFLPRGGTRYYWGADGNSTVTH